MFEPHTSYVVEILGATNVEFVGKKLLDVWRSVLVKRNERGLSAVPAERVLHDCCP